MSDTARRVVITGMGVISPLGSEPEALWEALIAGRSGVGRLESVPSTNLPTSIAAEATQFTGKADNFG